MRLRGSGDSVEEIYFTDSNLPNIKYDVIIFIF